MYTVLSPAMPIILVLAPELFLDDKYTPFGIDIPRDAVINPDAVNAAVAKACEDKPANFA